MARGRGAVHPRGGQVGPQLPPRRTSTFPSQGFDPKRVDAGIAKLQKARSGGAQMRVENFFTRAAPAAKAVFAAPSGVKKAAEAKLAKEAADAKAAKAAKAKTARDKKKEKDRAKKVDAAEAEKKAEAGDVEVVEPDADEAAAAADGGGGDDDDREVVIDRRSDDDEDDDDGGSPRKKAKNA